VLLETAAPTNFSWFESLMIPFRTSEFDVAISIRVLGSSVYQTLVQITVVWDTTIIDATIDFIHAYACTLLCSEECKDGCTKAWLFAEGPRDSQMAVSQCGSHGQKDVVHIRRRLAEQYAQTHTGGVALLKMEESGIPIEHRPEMWRLKNARPCRAEVRAKLTADCVASVQAWMAKPPENVCIMDSSICNADRISILFHFKDADSFLQQNQHLSVFVADFTFETNQQSLVLGGIGPAGLRSGGSQKPGVRMLPTHFLLSRKEDKESQMTLFKAFAAAAHRNGIRLSHGFADCSCMEGIQAVIESDPGLQHVQVHRCLHHTKQNVKQEVKRRNSETGEVRLRNMELLPVLLSFVMESAWFPSSLEFSSFWESVINRLRSNGEETDWDEPHVAQYLVRNLLEETGQAGVYSAPWRSGFGQVPAGFTTYTSNSLERSWRTIKGLLRKRTLLSVCGCNTHLRTCSKFVSYRCFHSICFMSFIFLDEFVPCDSKRFDVIPHLSTWLRDILPLKYIYIDPGKLCRTLRKKDVGSLMKGVCDSFHSKLAAGDYENLKAAVVDAPSCLHVRSQKQSVQVDSLDSEQEAQVVHRERLDLDALCKWFHKHGPTGTFVASVCNKPLDDGSTARLCYAFPKYCLQHALQKKPEMLAALQLGLSLTSEEVRHAAASPLTGLDCIYIYI